MLLGVALVGAALVCAGCKGEKHPPIALVTQRGKQVFEPRVAFAEYLELPGSRNELKITLASYDASCDRFVAPKDGETAVTVVIVTPYGQRPAAGTFTWSGAVWGADAGAVPPQNSAVPKAFVGKEGLVFRPGGAVELTRVVLEPNGFVEGVLAFEFGGDGKSAASSLKGPFRARFCRLEPATELHAPESKQKSTKDAGSH